MTKRFADKALQESRAFAVRRIPALRPLGWLARGASDFRRCPGPALAHGVAMAAFTVSISWWLRERFWLLAGVFSGLLMVAPLAATGLYAISRALDRGEPAGWRTAIAAWHPKDTRLVAFGLGLALAGAGWLMCSAALITREATAPVRTPADFLHLVVLADTGLLFEHWLALGALLAAPVFASTVVALPLLLDKEISVPGAVFTSWRVVMAHPAPMAMWAVIIGLMALLGAATAGLGLVVVLPWLAHASWHAYRDLLQPARR